MHPLRLTPGDVWHFAMAWLTLGAARILIGVLPFSWTRRLMGEPGPMGPAPPAALDDRQQVRAVQVATGLRRAVRRSPWRSDCYPQALAARVRLRALEVPHTMSFGLRRSVAGEMLAHAWVRAGEVRVSGGDGRDFVEVGSFSWSPRSLEPSHESLLEP